MPSASQIISSVIMTAVGVAVIFRIDALRGIVTGLSVAAKPGDAVPGTGRVLYM